MTNSIESIALDKLVAHPDNPNQQSSINFAKLVRNIERTNRYEPLIVRPCPNKNGHFQIINGCHRCHALTKLGKKSADCIIWDIDDEQTDILLATLNRLGGSDRLDKKLSLLKRLNEKMGSAELAKLLPYKHKQLERLVNLKKTTVPVNISKPQSSSCLAFSMVFFVNDTQQQIIKNALSLAAEPKTKMTKAAKNTAALTQIAQYFLKNSTTNSERLQ